MTSADLLEVFGYLLVAYSSGWTVGFLQKVFIQTADKI